MSRRLAVTPAQLRALLEVLTPFGFTAAKVELSPTGAVILHGDVGGEDKDDPLTAWETARGRRPH
ncbi:MAG: hypothetical protein K5831_08650 [Brevundimonas sp.]|jgi:hypothetical protein|uniref:hypothetical protein n=1 Tax=Brevundimonas TaxID=41275 RepID=UPI00201B522C|nr:MULTISPECIES: hypothetical protein [Brevundimonas]MCV0414940.1 hypothetical protein [Brevundimonas sp.]MEE2849164.1 hypothetical protein [Pseudomonadota bacterium]UQV19369.1 hypothetical protein MU852_06135 [Brevundimonas albigilva]